MILMGLVQLLDKQRGLKSDKSFLIDQGTDTHSTEKLTVRPN